MEFDEDSFFNGPLYPKFRVGDQDRRAAVHMYWAEVLSRWEKAAKSKTKTIPLSIMTIHQVLLGIYSDISANNIEPAAIALESLYCGLHHGVALSRLRDAQSLCLLNAIVGRAAARSLSLATPRTAHLLHVLSLLLNTLVGDPLALLPLQATRLLGALKGILIIVLSMHLSARTLADRQKLACSFEGDETFGYSLAAGTREALDFADKILPICKSSGSIQASMGEELQVLREDEMPEAVDVMAQVHAMCLLDHTVNRLQILIGFEQEEKVSSALGVFDVVCTARGIERHLNIERLNEYNETYNQGQIFAIPCANLNIGQAGVSPRDVNGTLFSNRYSFQILGNEHESTEKVVNAKMVDSIPVEAITRTGRNKRLEIAHSDITAILIDYSVQSVTVHFTKVCHIMSLSARSCFLGCSLENIDKAAIVIKPQRPMWFFVLAQRCARLQEATGLKTQSCVLPISIAEPIRPCRSIIRSSSGTEAEKTSKGKVLFNIPAGCRSRSAERSKKLRLGLFDRPNSTVNMLSLPAREAAQPSHRIPDTSAFPMDLQKDHLMFSKQKKVLLKTRRLSKASGTCVATTEPCESPGKDTREIIKRKSTVAHRKPLMRTELYGSQLPSWSRGTTLLGNQNSYLDDIAKKIRRMSQHCVTAAVDWWRHWRRLVSSMAPQEHRVR